MKFHQLHHHNDHVYHIQVFSKYNSYFYIRKNQDFEDMLQQLNKENKKTIHQRKKIIIYLENEVQLLFENQMIQYLHYL